MISVDDYNEVKDCIYKDEHYTARDNGAVMRHQREGMRVRKDDNVWTFGKPNDKTGYMEIAGQRVHRIVAFAFLGNPPTDQHVVDHIDTNRRNNRPDNLRWLTRLEKKILSGLKNEREWDEDWQYCLKHAKDVRKKGSITEVESAGSVSRDLADSIIDSYNQSLSNFVAEYSSLNKWFMLDQYSTIHAIVYRLFMSYMVSYPEVKKIFDEYPDNLGVKKLLETRSSLIKEFLQCELGQHWYNCILQDNGLELMGRFLVNHQDNITEEEEYHFLFLLDEICLITDILTGKEVESCLNVEYCETDEIDLGLTIANKGKQAGCVVDVNNENKNVVVHNITINVKKETNIEHNYENGAQHNDHSKRLTLNSDDADKGKLLE